MINTAPQVFEGKEQVSIGKTNLQAQLNYPLQLSYTCFFVCLKGRAVVSVNFRNYLLQANDILVLAGDSIVRFLRKSVDLEVFYCLIHKSFASEIAYNLPNSLFLYLSEYPLCRPQQSEVPFLEMWMQEIEHIKAHCHSYQYVMLRNHLQNFFLKIAEEMPTEDMQTHYQRSRKEMICWQFWEMIGKYCTTERSVAFYAQQLNITPFYLSQLTKQYLSDAPKDLIDRQVVLEMKALLTSSDLSIKEIADRLHFEDTSYMARYFKRHTGTTLTAYRK